MPFIVLRVMHGVFLVQNSVFSPYQCISCTESIACADADMMNFQKEETCNIHYNFHKLMSLQELAGYTGGDVSFLKEDFEFQFNKQLIWDSVIFLKIFQ